MLGMLQQLSREATALDTQIIAVVAKMEAAQAEGDESGYATHKVYDNLVACQRDLNAMRTALITQLSGRLVAGPCTPIGTPVHF